MFKMQWKVTPNKVWKDNYKAWVKSFAPAINELVKLRLPEIKQWLAEHHRWKNRTGRTEAALFATSMTERAFVHVAFGYGAESFHSVYLERNPRYAMLGDAIDYWGRVIYQDVKKAFDG